jgi:Zn-dependent peptidase ImmA (M78 family)
MIVAQGCWPYYRPERLLDMTLTRRSLTLMTGQGSCSRCAMGTTLMLVNPAHSRTQRPLTIAHEFGHLALGHRPIIVETDVGIRENRYSDVQEREATAYGAALLLPYAPLLQMLRQSASMRGIAHHYGVSIAAVEMRLKFTGLWGLQQR